MPQLWKLPANVGVAILKHYAKKAVGDEALAIVTDQVVDWTKSAGIEAIDEWLNGSKARKQLEAALDAAAVRFAATPAGAAVRDAGFTWRRSKSLADALSRMRSTPDDSDVRAALVDNFRSQLPADFPAAELDRAALELLRCVREGLATLKDTGPAIVAQATLRMERDLASLSAATADIHATVQRTETAITTFVEELQRHADATFRRAFIDFSAFVDDKTRGFVGRRFVFDAVDRFLSAATSGYFVLVGDPGIGKSAIMAQLVKTRQYSHHFNIASEGIGSTRQFFLNACAQLIARYGLPLSLPDDAGADNNYFKRVVAEAAKTSPRVVLIVDALDEATDPLTNARVNPLQFPASLPEHVFVVASTRRTTRQITAERVETFTLDATSAPNIRDIEEYITGFAARPAMQARLAQQQVSVPDFVAMVRDSSEGNFMYLHHVLPAVEAGRYSGAGTLQLPEGLAGYYQSHWEAMRGEDLDVFVRVNQKIIACLATAHRPVTLRFIARVTGLTPTEVQWTVQRWREFLHEAPGKDGPEFRIYHASYRDFLAQQVAE